MNDPIDDGGPAFPTLSHYDPFAGFQRPFFAGMSLRDYLAGQALEGDWAAQSDFTGRYEQEFSCEDLGYRAQLFYRMADAMLKAREAP